MRPSTVFGIVAKFLGWSLAIAVVCMAAIFGINSFDESPNPGIVEFLKSDVESVNDKDNAYFAVIGITAPRGDDIRRAGKSRLDRYASFLKANPAADRLDLDLILGRDRLAFKGDTSNLWLYLDPLSCKTSKIPCPSDRDVRKLLADNELLLKRYLTLHQYPRFYDVAHLFAGYVELVHLDQLMAANALLDAKSGHLRRALETLGKDLAFTRRSLKDRHDFVAMSVLQVDFSFAANTVSEIVRSYPAALESEAFPHEALKPEGKMPCRLSSVLAFELGDFPGYVSSLLTPTRDPESGNAAIKFLARHLFQMNASRNYLYDRINQQLALYSVPDKAFPEALGSYRKRYTDGLTWDFLYNPVGKIIVNPRAQLTSFTHCRALDGLLRLVSLQIELRTRKIPDKDIEAFLAKEPRNTNPLTGKPMVWNDKERLLTLSDTDGPYLSIRY